MNKPKPHGIDGITNEIIKLEVQSVLTKLTNVFDSIPKTKRLAKRWFEAKILCSIQKGKPQRQYKYKWNIFKNLAKMFTLKLQQGCVQII